ncbi:MAG: hypothetical protein A2021_07315 [Elusimicrobia bacterium GWF2_52_66]|nr:MAG: hypothetical protein A2X33_01360 [Elusimicrobia bacterium GWA2_51_34]OGR86404.1 MAG: hypothetical protein A2021_07315 [Elusimicrobia bacterium GWF2_52_66]HAF96175.1 hypothetical protein [Elusimicrobiota bacterium]HCE97786.1 hypothetical protein [Elusimicrobiota bacterium]
MSRSFGGPAEYNTSKALEEDSGPGPKGRDLSALGGRTDLVVLSRMILIFFSSAYYSIFARLAG